MCLKNKIPHSGLVPVGSGGQAFACLDCSHLFSDSPGLLDMIPGLPKKRKWRPKCPKCGSTRGVPVST